MDLTFTPSEEAFRAEARAWLEANVPVGLPSGDTAEGFALHVEWEKKLFDARWSVVSWPEEYGGQGGTLVDALVVIEELAKVMFKVTDFVMAFAPRGTREIWCAKTRFQLRSTAGLLIQP